MPRDDEHPAAGTRDWELGRLRKDFPGWDIAASTSEVTAVREEKRLTAGSAAVMRVHLGNESARDVRTGYSPELARLIRAYRDGWEIIPLPSGGYKAYRRPRKREAVAAIAGSARELRELLGEPDSGDAKPDSELRVTVSVNLRGAEAQRFMAAKLGDPEQWELINVSTGETFTPYGMDCAEDLAGCLVPARPAQPHA